MEIVYNFWKQDKSFLLFFWKQERRILIRMKLPKRVIFASTETTNFILTITACCERLCTFFKFILHL